MGLSVFYLVQHFNVVRELEPSYSVAFLFLVAADRVDLRNPSGHSSYISTVPPKVV